MTAPKFLDGSKYSRILVEKVKQELASLTGWNVTHADISKHLSGKNSVSRQMVSSVAAGTRTFGRKVFEEYAVSKQLTLRELLLSLVEWEKENRSLGVDSNQPLLERKLPKVEEWKIKVKDTLRQRFLVVRRKPSQLSNGTGGATDSAFRDVLAGVADVIELAFPGGAKNVCVLFLINPSGRSVQDSRCLEYARAQSLSDTDFSFRSVHDPVSTSSLVRSGTSVWKTLEDGGESLKPIWVRGSALNTSCSKNAVCFSVCAPCYRSSFQLLPSSNALEVRVSLHLTIELEDSVSEKERAFVASVVSSFAELVEYVCLGTVGDVLSAAYTAEASLDAAEVLISSWTSPPIERAEAAVVEWINSLKPKRKHTFVTSTFRKLLAADVWLFDRWAGNFYFRPQLTLHGTMPRSKEVFVIDTENGKPVSFDKFYERNIAKLCPRSQEGKSIECIGKSKYMVVDSTPESKELLRAEVAELLVGTKIGVPLVIHSTPNLLGVAWLRFECNLPKAEVNAVIASLHSSLSSERRFGGFVISPRFKLSSEDNTKKPRSKRIGKTHR